MEKLETIKSETGEGVSKEITVKPSECTKILCIKVYSGEVCLLIPLDKIEAVRIYPVVVEVPEAQDDLLGLSVYGKQIIPYFRITAESAGQSNEDTGKTDIRCGILLRTKKGLAGIAADEISGEEEVPAEELKEQIPHHLAVLLEGV